MQAGSRITHSARFNYNTFQIRARGASVQRRERDSERAKGGVLTHSTYHPPLTFLYTPNTSPDTTTATITVVLQGKLCSFF